MCRATPLDIRDLGVCALPQQKLEDLHECMLMSICMMTINHSEARLLNGGEG
jgi:hypothetical protein